MYIYNNRIMVEGRRWEADNDYWSIALINHVFLLDTDCPLVFPASVINGSAVSKTFQILYRNEDVAINDVILFKVHMLVDAQRVRISLSYGVYT